MLGSIANSHDLEEHAERQELDGNEAALAEALGAADIGGGSLRGPSPMTDSERRFFTPVDVLFSQWFIARDLLRLVFREKWASFDGAEVPYT